MGGYRVSPLEHVITRNEAVEIDFSVKETARGQKTWRMNQWAWRIEEEFIPSHTLPMLR